MPTEHQRGDVIYLVRSPSELSRAEYRTIERTMRRYDVVRHFLSHRPLRVARLCVRDPLVIKGVLRVLWQRRKLARALRRRGLPPWLASKQ